MTDSAKVRGGGEGGGRVYRSANDIEEGKRKAEWGRGAGVGWEETKPWRLRDRERRERETQVPAVMRGLKALTEGKD